MIPDEEVRLSRMVSGGGCAAKIGPGTLQGILESLPAFQDENLLVGIETSDDGAIYRISDELALIQTLDFFPPMVDDPFVFGQIAAANALSDIYAMGGEPKTALNIVAWPNCVNPKILGQILAGGADKVKEAGAVLAGGHSIQDDVPKYGLSVTGFVDPRRMYTNRGARPGDVLLLTKPLGTGIINTAVKADMASSQAEQEVIRVMTELNRRAAGILRSHQVHACTDVTGFGLAGHGAEMADGSGVSLEFYGSVLPVQPEAAEYARMGLVPEGSYRNREYLKDRTWVQTEEAWLEDIFFDPQTSGGLLVSLEESEAEAVEQEAREEGLPFAICRIGKVKERERWSICLTE